MDDVRSVFAQNLKRLRSGNKLTQQALADRLADLGYPLDRTAIVRMESSGAPNARKATIEDLFALALALNTSPTNLLVPAGPDEQLNVTPAVTTDATTARRWFRGWEALPDQDAGLYEDLAPKTDWFLLHDGLFLAYAESIERLAVATIQKDRPAQEEARWDRQAIHNTVAEVLGEHPDIEPPENPAVGMTRSEARGEKPSSDSP